ncbi:MAG: hypothetical protein A2W98_10010 [Bacteroidetes bacterium GWF2_33_38]|nr:MAG: hypothetical protein A2W98_10010 [Bacteroidetes bacterium GWF2_33_38]OFY68509.1 MAG: hypothetical protein A2265_07755 [Bacteroidetes bacterium RIFOXYA12_FULL_33_9]OFY91614.1 MAG: hypothetical protein A2236_11485 [Bacteroidetes bacterium RIFOXYA2_FULL_33_7]HBX52580.1 hypothetical protein [Bacteroidales bacterium]
MRRVDTQKLSGDECWGIQMYGLNHCKEINCKWRGISACNGKNIIKTGKNSKGFVIDDFGLSFDDSTTNKNDKRE